MISYSFLEVFSYINKIMTNVLQCVIIDKNYVLFLLLNDSFGIYEQNKFSVSSIQNLIIDLINYT